MRNFSQGDLSRLTGFPVQQISKYERGENVPGSKNLSKIAEALNVTVSMLTGETVAETSEPYRVARFIRPLTPEQEEVLKLLEEDPAAKEMFETYIRLPKSKKRMHLARMLEDLEELQEKDKEGQGGARP